VVQSEREFHCGECGHHHYITPIPAAGALILDREGRLLVIRRAHAPGFGKLGLPGGVIEPNETGEEAAARETEEEVGLRVDPSSFRYLVSLNNQYEYQGFIWPTIDLFYACELASFEGIVAAPAEVSEVLLIPPREVPLEEFAFESNAEAVRRLMRTSV
jgi:ADP-ribose pyrophosphatase